MQAALINKIVRWIRFCLKKAKAKGIVLGLSGGIDSAVVAALAKKAVGVKKALVLILPIDSQKKDLKDALLLAKQLGLRVKIIDLSFIYNQLLRILPQANKLASANIKPRLRMIVLYYFANRLNYLVCGTGNKSELTVGYFTKHGDGATDILPIGNLLKRDVVLLARKLGIPEDIVVKPPTAGLWPGQTDEGEMGITYLELDAIIESLEKGRKPPILKAKVDKVKKMIKASEHKRQGPKIYGLYGL
jgi:NAD+ synthase